MDGVDLKNHIVATYYMKDTLEGEKFIEHFSLIQALALEGSTGTWEKVEEDTADVRVKLSGKMVGYFEIPSDRALHQGGGGPARLPHRRVDRQRAHDAPVHRGQLLRLFRRRCASWTCSCLRSC